MLFRYRPSFIGENNTFLGPNILALSIIRLFKTILSMLRLN